MKQEDIIRMACEAGGYLAELPNGDVWLFDGEEQLAHFAALVAAAEREAFYGQDKPAECANGCPINQICDYCQIVRPARELVADAIKAEREACAKVCDAYGQMGLGANSAANAIRARGQA